MGVSKNEEQVCSGVARWFARAHGEGCEPRLLARPDQEHGRVSQQPKAVEQVVLCGSHVLAIEHTLVFAIDDQEANRVRIDKLLGYVAGELTKDAANWMPGDGSFHLTIPYGSLGGLKWSDYDRLQAEAIAAIKVVAPSLTPEKRWDEIPLAGGRMRLRVDRFGVSGQQVHIGHQLDSKKLWDNALASVSASLNKKLPKLHAEKTARGANARSILALEENVGALLSPSKIQLAVKECLAGAPALPAPDWIVVVETNLDPWFLSPIFDGHGVIDDHVAQHVDLERDDRLPLPDDASAP